MVRHIPITAIALAGVGHLIIALGHSSHAFPHVVFFFLIGTAQLLWALTFWRYFFPKLYWAGLAVSGGTFHIWILTQLVSVPFALTADVIYPWPVAIISSELVGFVTLMGLMGRAQLAAYTGRSVARLIGGGLVIALVFGTVVWGGSHLTEVIFPGQGTSDGHQVGHEQAHQVVTRPPATPMPAPNPGRGGYNRCCSGSRVNSSANTHIRAWRRLRPPRHDRSCGGSRTHGSANVRILVWPSPRHSRHSRCSQWTRSR